MKNTVKKITIILIILAVVIGTVGARASLFLSRYVAYQFSGENSREVVVEYSVSATRPVDSVGVYKIVIKNSTGASEKLSMGQLEMV